MRTTAALALRPSRRVMLAAAAVLVGLSACGDAVTPQAGSLPVIELAGGAGKVAAGAAPAESMDSRMMMPMYLDYAWAGDDSGLPTTAPAFRFVGSPTADDARRLADVLGVQGEVTEQAADMGGGWVVGPNDGSAPMLTLSIDGLGSWWYSAGYATSISVGCGVAEPAVSTDDTSAGEAQTQPTVVEPCPEPEPPVGIPSEDETRQRTIDTLAALGVDPGTVEIEVYADEWSANATVFPLLDGIRTSMAWSFGYGENGVLTWASGSTATLEPAAEYPLIGCAAGVDRLNDQNDAWMTGGIYPMARGTAASGYEPAADSAVGAPEPMPVDPAVSELMPVDTTPIVVTLTACRLDRTMQWDVDGTVWLLPAYTFTADDGGEYTVIAIGDDYIAPPPAVEVPDTTAPPVTVPVPVDSVPVEPPTTDVAADLTVDEAEILVGLTLDEATKLGEENRWVVRPLRIDGVDQVATMDYRTDRVNVEITDGIVTSIISIG